MNLVRHAAVLAASVTFALANPVQAQTNPLMAGEYVEVSSITIDDGHSLDYANFLAGYWRAQEDYAKSQGWITSYEIMANIHKRPGEPDLYLVERRKTIPDAKEVERREQMMRDHVKLTDAQMEAASGERAKFRHVIGSSLMQVLNYR